MRGAGLGAEGTIVIVQHGGMLDCFSRIDRTCPVMVEPPDLMVAALPLNCAMRKRRTSFWSAVSNVNMGFSFWLKNYRISSLARSEDRGALRLWLQQPVVVCLDRRVAFAGRLSETVEIDDFDMAAAVMNMVSLLQRAGSQRDAVRRAPIICASCSCLRVSLPPPDRSWVCSRQRASR